jgi:hypothetical protein
MLLTRLASSSSAGCRTSTGTGSRGPAITVPVGVGFKVGTAAAASPKCGGGTVGRCLFCYLGLPVVDRIHKLATPSTLGSGCVDCEVDGCHWPPRFGRGARSRGS